ncbi:Tetratricopeptide repeat protein 29 [Cichlidogyrus casuarinus]|uniref:Tetratricopeptide repeat protein 29 n=1 Tax=Cichlidogyrus casuarinus TaxID=1844966 RepID=A0ABD2QIZ1_9PLAT
MVGRFEEANAACLEMYELAKGRRWVSLKMGEDMELLACRRLIDNYLTEMDKRPAEEIAQRLLLARKAVKVGLLSKNYELQVYVNNYVSPIMEQCGSLQDVLEVSYASVASLLQFNRSFFHVCHEMNDPARLRNICVLLQRLYDRADKSQECIKYLHKFAQVAEMKEDWVSLSVAYQLLGIAFDRCGDYENSLKWNRKAYDMPKYFIVSSLLASSKCRQR